MRYADDRLYDTGTARYVTVQDIIRMQDRLRCEVVIREASSGEDITDSVLDRRAKPTRLIAPQDVSETA